MPVIGFAGTASLIRCIHALLLTSVGLNALSRYRDGSLEFDLHKSCTVTVDCTEHPEDSLSLAPDNKARCNIWPHLSAASGPLHRKWILTHSTNSWQLQREQLGHDFPETLQSLGKSLPRSPFTMLMPLATICSAWMEIVATKTPV